MANPLVAEAGLLEALNSPSQSAGAWLAAALVADVVTFLTDARTSSVLPWLLLDIWLTYRIAWCLVAPASDPLPSHAG
jgi:hypothetical protein